MAARMWNRVLATILAVTVGGAAFLTGWVAYPSGETEDPPPPLAAVTDQELLIRTGYTRDLAALVSAFEPQRYRSYCGPASIATVLRAYGVRPADQVEILASTGARMDAFFTGMSLSELAALAERVGLRAELVYADTLTPESFRERLTANLTQEGDFVVVNYQRGVLNQGGAGHISPVGAYDPDRDAFLVLDTAAYRYPFTWVPASLLYDAVHTKDGDRFRGVLFIHGYTPPG